MIKSHFGIIRLFLFKHISSIDLMKRNFIQIVKDILPRRKFIHRHENCIMYELSGAELLTIHDKFTIPSYQR